MENLVLATKATHVGNGSKQKAKKNREELHLG